MSRISSTVVGLLLFFQWQANEPRAEVFKCPNRTPAQGAFGYQKRGDRCEGLIFRRDASAALVLEALTTTSMVPSVDSHPLVISWKSPGKGAVALHSDSLKATTLYQMDTTVLDADSWEWPTDVLRGIALSPRDTGLLGAIRWKVLDSQTDAFDTEREVYLPLTVRTDRSRPVAQSYRVLVAAGVDLVQVYTRIILQDTSGATSRIIRDREPLNQGPYPAGKKIVIEVPTKLLPKSGIYALEIGARLKLEGGVSSTTVHFYHARGR